MDPTFQNQKIIPLIYTSKSIKEISVENSEKFEKIKSPKIQENKVASKIQKIFRLKREYLEFCKNPSKKYREFCGDNVGRMMFLKTIAETNNADFFGADPSNHEFNYARSGDFDVKNAIEEIIETINEIDQDREIEEKEFIVALNNFLEDILSKSESIKKLDQETLNKKFLTAIITKFPQYSYAELKEISLDLDILHKIISNQTMVNYKTIDLECITNRYGGKKLAEKNDVSIYTEFENGKKIAVAEYEPICDHMRNFGLKESNWKRVISENEGINQSSNHEKAMKKLACYKNSIKEIKNCHEMRILENISTSKEHSHHLEAKALFSMIKNLPEIIDDFGSQTIKLNIARLHMFLSMAVLLHAKNQQRFCGMCCAIIHEISLLLLEFKNKTGNNVVHFNEFQDVHREEFIGKNKPGLLAIPKEVQTNDIIIHTYPHNSGMASFCGALTLANSLLDENIQYTCHGEQYYEIALPLKTIFSHGKPVIEKHLLNEMEHNIHVHFDEILSIIKDYAKKHLENYSAKKDKIIKAFEEYKKIVLCRFEKPSDRISHFVTSLPMEYQLKIDSLAKKIDVIIHRLADKNFYGNRPIAPANTYIINGSVLYNFSDPVIIPGEDLNKFINNLPRNEVHRVIIMDITSSDYSNIKLDSQAAKFIKDGNISLIFWRSAQKFSLIHTDQAQYGEALVVTNKKNEAKIKKYNVHAEENMANPDVLISTYIHKHCYDTLNQIRQVHFDNAKIATTNIFKTSSNDSSFFTLLEDNLNSDIARGIIYPERDSFGHYITTFTKNRLSAGTENPHDILVKATAFHVINDTLDEIEKTGISKKKYLFGQEKLTELFFLVFKNLSNLCSQHIEKHSNHIENLSACFLIINEILKKYPAIMNDRCSEFQRNIVEFCHKLLTSGAYEEFLIKSNGSKQSLRHLTQVYSILATQSSIQEKKSTNMPQ